MKMDDGNKQHSYGGGAQRNSHPRPFFYVQPPSQPYYLYQQWQLNNPYSHYGIPGAFNIGRPCIQPYPFAPYPGFVLPHAPIYPVDYRRMFEPRFPGPSWGDVPRQHHNSEPYGRPEMACSEAQTDPSEAIAKLIECLSKIRTTDLQVSERELDSGVASQSSSVFSPEGEKKNEVQGHGLSSALEACCTKSPAVTPNNSTPVLYDESSQVVVSSINHNGCWTEALEEELPIDSSSVHEECPELERSASDQHLSPLEKEVFTDIQTNISGTEPGVSRCDAECSAQTHSFLSTQTAHGEDESSNKASTAELFCEEVQAEESCHIVKLPSDNGLTPGAAGLCSPSASYFYNYLSVQSTHERMSVLSPSLDELSSRDEMFSTDLEEAELFPKRVYPGRRLAGAISRSSQASEDAEESWFTDSKRFICACCGKNLANRRTRSKSKSSKMHREDAGDSEEDRYGRGCEEPVRVVVRKHGPHRKAHPLPRLATKSVCKRSQYPGISTPVEKGQKQDAEVATEVRLEPDNGELQCGTCQDEFCRDLASTEQQYRWADEVSMPRRRQSTPLQRRDLSSPWKLYQRSREEEQDEQLPLQHHERGMAAATSTFQPSFGLGSRGPNPTVGAEPTRRPHQTSSGPTHSEGQHQKPFCYIQQSQPYLPMQWSVPMPVPMPMSYNPYYGYPGLGYGLPMMPHYQPNPYIEPPGFVVPHNPLHLMDYRRLLNPQYYQTMAYHSQRFRYQHHSAGRKTTSSEVQTEPLATSNNTNRHADGFDTSSLASAQTLSPVPANQMESLCSKTGNKASSATSTPSKGSFVVQTEEVRIECCTTPVGLQLLHAHESAETSQSFSKDAVQCASNLESNGLQDKQMQSNLQVSPDIVFSGVPTTSTVPFLDNDMTATPPSTNLGSRSCDKADKDLSMTSRNFLLEVVNLPFDSKFLDQLRKIESTIWSAREPLTTNTESLMESASEKTRNEALPFFAELNPPEMQMREEIPTNEVIHATNILPLMEDELQDLTPTVDSQRDEIMSETPQSSSGDTQISETTNTEVDFGRNSMRLDSPPVNKNENQQSRLTDPQEQQDTSFESLPTYLPSTSWFSDLDNFFYYSKIPPAPKKQCRSLSHQDLDVSKRRQKADIVYNELPNVRKHREKCKPKGKLDRQCLSDHECCLSKNLNENLLNPYVSKTERLCSRCVAKHKIFKSPSPGIGRRSLKRKAVPFQQWNNVLLPTCDECKSHTKQLMRKHSNTDTRSVQYGNDVKESPGNNSCQVSPKFRVGDDGMKLTDSKRLLGSKQNVNQCPVTVYPKLREKNCVHTELQNQSVPRERLPHCPYGNTIREIDENCAMPVSFQDKHGTVKHLGQKHSWYVGKLQKDMNSYTDHGGFKNDASSQLFNPHKKSQETFTKESQ